MIEPRKKRWDKMPGGILSPPLLIPPRCPALQHRARKDGDPTAWPAPPTSSINCTSAARSAPTAAGNTITSCSQIWGFLLDAPYSQEILCVGCNGVPAAV